MAKALLLLVPRTVGPWKATGAVQALYCATTGFWAAAHVTSFMGLAGEKQDEWLVRTLGLLVAVIGAANGDFGCRPRLLPAA